MPTDDDYGRRERLLLHPTAQYGLSASSVSGPTSGNSTSNVSQIGSSSSADCYHKHSDFRVSSCSSNNQEPRSQSNDHNEYGLRDRQVIGSDCYEKSVNGQQITDSSGKPELQSETERFGKSQNQDRFNQISGAHQIQHQFASGRSSCHGISQNHSDRFSRFNESNSHHNSQSAEHRYQQLPSVTERFHQSHSESRLPTNAGSSEYANASVLLSNSGNPFSCETFPSPPSPAPTNDCFVPPPPLSPTPSEKYSSSQSLAGYPVADRILSSSSPNTRDRYGTAPASPISSAKERFSSAERLLANSSSVNESKEQQRHAASSTERLASPVVGSMQSDRCVYNSNCKDSTSARFGLSTERLLSSSPIHAPVPEKFASKSSDRYHSESPIHDRYLGTSHHQDRYSSSTAERFLSSSPNPEGAHQRYSPSERIHATSNDTEQPRRFSNTDRSIENACQKYIERQGTSAVSAEYTTRLQGHQDTGSAKRFIGTTDRFNDLAIQRYAQTRPTDRFISNERYIISNSPARDLKQTGNEIGRYASNSSTERLLISSSSASAEVPRTHHQTFTSSVSTQSSVDRYSPLSPTPESNTAHRNYSQATSKSNDKYLPPVSKSVQSYSNDRYQLSNQTDLFESRTNQDRYGLDRYANVQSNNDRFQLSGQELFHGPTDRYSPTRNNAEKFLSLPKPKDRYMTGRITTSCASVASCASERTYGSGNGSYVPPTAHTPVERYVPQPPPEVLYPERYVERYMPPTTHTTTDRYLSATDPGDPYMRRDLGFHHHYRLPPPGYPYHQTHIRFRSFAYASPGRLGGSPSSSSSSSSTSAQRDGFSTSPLLRPKVRTTPAEFSTNPPRHVCTNPPVCCSEITSSQRSCCQPVRRSLPPGALPAIPAQSGHSSWQPSPNSGTASTSTGSSTCADGESGQSIGLYAVGGSNASTETSTTPTTSAPSTASCATGCPSSGVGFGSTSNITRSASAPAGPRPQVPTATASATTTATTQRPRLRRNQSRTDAIRNYIKRETATFFGVDEDSEALERQRWLDRRRRMASRKYGALLPEYRPPDPDITKDVPDSMDIPESVTLRKWQRPVRRKDSVARMTLSGLHYMVETLTRQRSGERSGTSTESRSFPPNALSSGEQADGGTTTDAGLDEEEDAFFKVPPPVAPSPTSPMPQETQQVQSEDQRSTNPADEGAAAAELLRPASATDAPEGPSRNLAKMQRLAAQTILEKRADDRTSIEAHDRRQRAMPRDHTTFHYSSRNRPEHQEAVNEITGVKDVESVGPRREVLGGKRISPHTIDRVFDNSNRRQYGMGIAGRFFGRSFRKSVSQKPDVRKQLDDFEDHRPYFTYWITTVQILILIISIACYGFGPVGLDVTHRSGLVLVTSLSLQQVDYQEPANFWIGPRASDLIHLGAKFAPCMRRDIKILKEIDVWRERERDTACCIRNDDSGCVQSSRAECSNTISTWKKWGPADNGPGGRISGSVCGLDPKFCDAPASVAPYEWPDDITKWPICRKTNPFSQRFRSKDGGNFPVGRYKDKMAEHMVCEVIGHPCCIGIHGMCRITTKEYCDFVHGYFHEEASLCSQVECLHDVCGMIPFLHPEWPDQFYRLFTTTFLHAGILHIVITILIQYFLMRDLEKLTGSVRIALIYFIGALAGNLASAIFIPYRAEVGPAGAHFALLATLVVEVLHCWPMLKYPRRALSKLIFILVGLLLLGALPWVDNYAHLFGFIFGFLAAYALMPFISFGHYDRRRKIFLIWICLILIVGLFTLLLALFYNVPVYECEVCKLFNCIPFTRDFCASQNINFKREEPV